MLFDTFIYNKEANNRMIESVMTTADRPQKVLELTSHILIAHRIWLTRITAPAGAGNMNPWSEVLVSDFISMNNQLHLDTEKMLKEEDLTRRVSYVNTKGESYRNSVQEICMHLLLHSAYHRGQVAQLLRDNGSEPAVTDYIFYKRMLGD